jgi:hypothetical protein
MRLLHSASHLATSALAADPESSSQSTPAPATATEIKPPFGLSWGDDQTRLERLLTNGKATIASREQTGTGEELHVTGLLQDGLKETRFRFVDGALSAVTLVYERPAWSEAELQKFFHEVRQRIEQRYGPPFKPNYGAADGNAPERYWRREGILRLQRQSYSDGSGQIIVIYSR